MKHFITILIFLFSITPSFAKKAPLKILSLDGGGIRGVVPLVFLIEIRKATGIDVAKQTDVFAGTSTGSIIASGLALGIDVETLLKMYIQVGPDIFQRTPLQYVDALLEMRSKYSNDNLKNAIHTLIAKCGLDPDTRFEQLNKKLVIPTVCLNSDGEYGWHMEVRHNLSDQNQDLLIVDAALQSSAAPSYFPSYQDCIDGGLVAHNPSLIALTLALQYNKIPLQKAVLFSLGTGFMKDFLDHDEDWSIASWMYQTDPSSQETTTPLISMLFDLQAQMPEKLCERLLQDNFCRLDMELTQNIALDNAAQMQALVNITKNYIKEHPDKFKEVCNWVRKHFKR